MHHIVIVGAGIIGISTAYFLSHSPSAQDHTITIFDPSPPVSGASGKAAGFISWCWTGSATASLEELSFKLYEELAQEYAGAEKWSYRQCRALAISGRMPEGEQHNLWVERFKRFKQTEYSGELGWITSEMATTGILLGGAGSFAQWFLLEKAQSKGVNLVTARATSLSVVDGRVTGIDVDLGDMKTRVVCDKVVIAAGPWSGPLSEVLLPKPIPITSYAGHSILIQPSVVPGADCLFMTVRIQNSAYDVQIIPRSSGEIYISGVNDTLPLPSTPDAAIPLKTEIDKLKEIADIILPRYSIKKEQLCFRPMTDKGTPFICPYVAVNGVYIGVGHGHFGIILGPGTGKVLSEMILGEKLSADISQLSL